MTSPREVPVYFEDQAAAQKHYVACSSRRDLTVMPPQPIALRRDKATSILGNVGDQETDFFMGWVVRVTTWSLD
jgi:hypothetical protein